jgi:hypothetical protein
VVLAFKASLPTAVLFDAVLNLKLSEPTAVLQPPVKLHKREVLPTAMLCEPSVLKSKASMTYRLRY